MTTRRRARLDGVRRLVPGRFALDRGARCAATAWLAEDAVFMRRAPGAVRLSPRLIPSQAD